MLPLKLSRHGNYSKMINQKLGLLWPSRFCWMTLTLTCGVGASNAISSDILGGATRWKTRHNSRSRCRRTDSREMFG